MKKTGNIRKFQMNSDKDSILRIDQQFPHSWNEQTWDNFLLGKDFDLWVFEDGDEIRGFSLYNLNDLLKEAHLLKVVVDSSYRQQGIGRGLLLGNIESYREERNLFLEVATSNDAAIELYKSLGFKELNVVKSFYRDGGDALRMKLQIC